MHISTQFLLSIALAFGLSYAETILRAPFDCVTASVWEVCQNEWDAGAGVGHQTTTLISANADSVSWSTNWTWTGGQGQVKTYPNVLATKEMGVQLSAIKSAPSTWEWQYRAKSPGFSADVAYDVWFGASPTGTPASSASAFEVMIWLSFRNTVPTGPVVATNILIADNTWNLHGGTAQTWKVFSFVNTKEDVDIKNFSADLNEFFKYLTANQSVPSTHFVQNIQAGIEALTGTVELVTKQYSVKLIKN